MTSVIEFKAEHLEKLNEQRATAYLVPFFPKHMRVALEKSKWAYTVSVDGRPVLCAGVIEFWPGRGEAWAVLDGACRKEFISVHNTVKRFLEVCPLRRIEASVQSEFEAGHRWVKMLGFKMESPRRKAYWPNGGDAALYAKVREA